MWLDTQDAQNRDRNPSNFTLDLVSDLLVCKLIRICSLEFYYFTYLCSTCVSDISVFFRELIMVRMVFVLIFYREDCFDRGVILFNSRICVCDWLELIVRDKLMASANVLFLCIYIKVSPLCACVCVCVCVCVCPHISIYTHIRIHVYFQGYCFFQSLFFWVLYAITYLT